jgi:hypothetical protein
MKLSVFIEGVTSTSISTHVNAGQPILTRLAPRPQFGRGAVVAWAKIINEFPAALPQADHSKKTKRMLRTITRSAKGGSLTQNSRARLQASLEAAAIFPRPRIDPVKSTKSRLIFFSRDPYSNHELGFKISSDDRYRGIVLSTLGGVPALADSVAVHRNLQDIKKASKIEEKEHPALTSRIDFVGRRKRHDHKHWMLIEFRLCPNRGLVSQLAGYLESFVERHAIDAADTIEAIVSAKNTSQASTANSRTSLRTLWLRTMSSLDGYRRRAP